MNHRQKLGYMALGALILAIGITIGQFITPNIEAQQNDFFDQITCRQLTVVDDNGKKVIGLGSSNQKFGNVISIYDQTGREIPGINGEPAIMLQNFEKEIVYPSLTKMGKRLLTSTPTRLAMN